MQAYYDRHLFPGAQLQLSFAGTLMELFFNLGGPIYQVMSSKMGIRFVLVLASILITLGLELAGFSTEVRVFPIITQRLDFLNISLDLALVSDSRSPVWCQCIVTLRRKQYKKRCTRNGRLKLTTVY